jgi:FdhE protein
MSSTDTLQSLERAQPEWKRWLRLIREVLAAIDGKAWDNAIPERRHGGPGDAPLLCDAAVHVDADTVATLMERLRENGSRDVFGPVLRAADNARLLTLFESALNADDARLRAFACEADADPDVFTAAAALLPLPLLHACAARWMNEVPEAWSAGYCPICGAWPAFAEMRGVERMRFLRCGRCGLAWQAPVLWCAYCGIDDHEALESLIVEQSMPPAVIEACTRCRGYVKVFTTLMGAPPAQVMLEDLSSAALDFHAVRRGYHRRGGLGRALDATVVR